MKKLKLKLGCRCNLYDIGSVSVIIPCLDLIYDTADLDNRSQFEAHILEHHLTL